MERPARQGIKVPYWEVNRTIPFASDLLSAAFTLGKHKEAAEAARFLLSQSEGVPAAARALAWRVLNRGEAGAERLSASEELIKPEKDSVRGIIRDLRGRLREEPRNTIAYVDLARAYTLLDNKEQAKRAIEMALRLSPENRFVLRSAARFFIHLDEPDIAHRLLRRAEATRFDPWLLSAEIAVASAAENSARFAQAGVRLLADDTHASSEVTELSSALATLQMENGKTQNARKLFRKALISPTENSVAQIERASRWISGLDFIRSADFEDVPRIYEARAWEHLTVGEWAKALEHTWNWFYDRSFLKSPLSGGDGSTMTSGARSKNLLRIGKSPAREAADRKSSELIVAVAGTESRKTFA